MSDCCPTSGPITIVQGEQAIFTLKLRTDCDPLDLTSYDEIAVCLANQDGTVLMVTHVDSAGTIAEFLGDKVLGKIKVTISPADTALLKEGAKQDISLELNINATPAPLRKNLKDVLIVESSLCA